MTELTIRAVTPERRGDLLSLFGDNGAYSNCWCTWFLLTGRGFENATPAERRTLLLEFVEDGREPGLLAYRAGVPVGWCAVGPREWYRRMTNPRARTYKAVDDQPSWVVNCFYIDKAHRGSGVASALLAGAIDHAKRAGATLLEGYPEARDFRSVGASSMFVGTSGMFEREGFVEITRRGHRPVMRLDLGATSGPDPSTDPTPP